MTSFTSDSRGGFQRSRVPDRASQLISDLQTWRVHSPVPEDVLIAIALQARYRLSFWDSMILRSANALGCAVLWTEDLSDGQIVESVEVRNPLIAGSSSPSLPGTI